MEPILNTHQVNDQMNAKQQVCAALDKGGGDKYTKTE